ncbi:MAG: 30S ribosome-binding factor RbfA [Rickettsiales bacterium]|nr:30S ribosome-binding factor RbfA [Rickettsiales bacterium]
MSIRAAKKAPSQRQLRVGEEIRHAISEVLSRGETHLPELDGYSITVSEVRISPDLKNATVYVSPLAGERGEEMVEALNKAVGAIRRIMNKKIVLKYSPKLFFKYDRSFESANRVNVLLNQPEVRRDVVKSDGDESAE